MAAIGSMEGHRDSVRDGMTELKELNECRAIVKLKERNLHLIKDKDVQQLFDILDTDESGEIALEELRKLKGIKELNLSDADIDAFIADCDKDNNGKLSKDELPHLLNAMLQGSLNMKFTLQMLGQGGEQKSENECKRDELLEFLKEEHETNDALCSLPITLLSFFLFFILVTIHLQVEQAYGMQSAIQGEVEGEGKPYLGTYVHDVPTFYDWMKLSFIPAQFKSSSDKLKQYPYPGRFAVYNQIVGGTQVKKVYTTENGTCSQGGKLALVYDQLYGGRCHRGGDTDITSEFFLYHLDKSEMVKHVEDLDKTDWITHNTLELHFENLYFNAEVGLFTYFDLMFDWQSTGYVKIVFGMESFAATPYLSWWYIIVDALYIMILLRMTYQELKEMLPRMMNGLDGFIQYWEFWNVVDWLNIIFGSISFAMWGLICKKVETDLQDAIYALPTKKLDDWVVTNQTYFTLPQLKEVISIPEYTGKLALIHEHAAAVASMHKDLRTITFFYSFTLMLKFFKAFQANPRLNIVVMTMQDSAIDIIHFSIVFVTIFFVFSLMAHVVFGCRMLAFSDQSRSFFMTWRVLLGDFELDEMEQVSFDLANIWFLVFQVLVMMILLNMLLAIIMDTYSAVVGKSGNKTIWDQTRDAVSTVRETRGHLPLLYIRCEMEDEDDKTHPRNEVTAKTLRKAFENDKMTRPNAEYLIRKTKEYIKANEDKCELQLHDAVRLVGQTKTMVMKINDVTHETLDMLKKAENAPREARQDALMAGYDPDDPHYKDQMRADGYHQDKHGSQNMMLTNGVPIRNDQFGSNSGYGAPMINILNDGNLNHPNAIMDDPNPQVQTGGSPFAPSNAQNTRLYGLSPPTYTGNMGTQGGYAQNNTMGSSMPQVTNISVVQMAYPQQGGTTMTAPTQQMQGSGGGQQKSEMQEVMERMRALEKQNTDIFDKLKTFIKERDAWMERGLNTLDRRCQKVEVLSDRLYTLLRDVDIQKIADVPHAVREALGAPKDNNFPRDERERQVRGGVYMSGEGSHLIFDSAEHTLRSTSGEMEQTRPPSMDDLERDFSNSGQYSFGGARNAKQSQRLEERLNAMSDQLEQLLSLAEETPKMTKMLWNMDLQLRKLSGTANSLPPGHPLLQQQQQQAMQLAIESSSRRSSRQVSSQGPPMRGTNSQAGSRMVSKTSFLPVPEGNS